MRGQLLAFGDVALHFTTAARVQPMPRLKQVHRCAHERIDSFRSHTPEPVILSEAKRSRRIPRTYGQVPPRDPSISLGMTDVSHAFWWRVGQVIRRELKYFTQFRIKTFERSGQFVLDALACIRFLQLGKI